MKRRVGTRDARFLRQAIRLAAAGMKAGRGGPFGAVVVRGSTVVGRGCNRVTTRNDPTAHAEIVAIREACRRLRTFSLAGCRIYCSCEPCPMCRAAIHWARLDAVGYAATRDDAARAGFDDALLYDAFRRSSGRKALPVRRALRAAARRVMAAWARKRDRVPY
jgi:tRNA(Arg) A34 adenosine deaminase TadA